MEGAAMTLDQLRRYDAALVRACGNLSRIYPHIQFVDGEQDQADEELAALDFALSLVRLEIAKAEAPAAAEAAKCSTCRGSGSVFSWSSSLSDEATCGACNGSGRRS
jgi:hypothetical protein